MFRTTVATLLVALFFLSVATQAEAEPRNHRKAAKHAPLKVLPKTHRRIVHKGNPYFYSGGRFYRHNNGVYVAITAPLGAIVPSLPGGYVTFGVGAKRYFYHEGIYYRNVPTGYVVIEEPAKAETVLASVGSDKLIIYPAANQSAEQTSRDKYECHEWANSETNFDPTDSDSDPLLRADYQRAMGACLEARQYVVK